jgi:Integrase core domain
VYQIPLEILYRLDEKITNLPNNGKLRRLLIHEVAVCYQLSESTVYRQLKKLMLHPSQRMSRNDKGCPKIINEEELYHYCQLIAAMKIRSMNGKKHMLSTAHCIKFLEEDGVKVKDRTIRAPKKILTASTVNRYLNLYWISPNDILSEPTVNHFEAAYSNQCWQLDITPSELHRLPSQHPDDPRRLMVYSVIDDKSGLSYSCYYLAEGEDTLTVLDFLYHAFAKMTDLQTELYGIPDFIYTDNASFVKSRLFMRVMSKLGVQVLTHLPRGKGGRKTTARAKGKSERLHRSIKSTIEPCYRFELPKDLEQANGCLGQVAVEIAHKKHRTQSMTRYQVWKTNLPAQADLSICSYEHYSLLLREPVDRKVKSDATVQLNGSHYQLLPQFAGEEVTLLLSLDNTSIHIEYREKEYGPFLPIEAPTPFGEYNHHKKSEKEQAADNVVELSRHITLHLPTFENQVKRTTFNLNTNLLPATVKKYNTPLEAKLALATHLGKPLSILNEKQKRFIDALTQQTLEHDILITQLNEYMALKLIPKKE